MSIRVSATEDPHELGKGGEAPAPGRYHVVITEIDDSFTKSPKSIPVTLSVLAGTVPGQEGKTTREFLYYDPNDVKKFAVDRLSRLAWASGLIAAGEDADLDLNECVGCQCVVELYEDTYTKDGQAKKVTRVSWRDGGMWPIGDSEVSDVPLDQEQAKHRKTRGQGGGGGTAASGGGNVDPFGGGGQQNSGSADDALAGL